MKNEVSCRISAALIKYLEDHGYDAVCLYSDSPYGREFLLNRKHRIPEQDFNRLAERAVALTGRADLMFEIGRTDPPLPHFPGVRSLIRILSTPRIAFGRVGHFGRKFCNHMQFQVDMIDRDSALIRLSYDSTKDPAHYAYQFIRGVLTALPDFWSLPPAEITELYYSGDAVTGGPDTPGAAPAERLFEIKWRNPDTLVCRINDRLHNRRSGISNTISILEKHFSLLNEQNNELVHQNKLLASVRQIAVAIDSSDTADQILQKIVELCRDIPGVGFAVLARIDPVENRVNILNYSRVRDAAIINGLKKLGIDIESDPDTFLTNQFYLSPAEMKVILRQTHHQKVLRFDRLNDVLHGVWSEKLSHEVHKLAGFRKYVLLPLYADRQNWFGLFLALHEDISLDILEMLKSHTSIALKNSHTLEKLSRRNQELSTLNSIAAKITQSQVIDRIVEQTIQQVINVFQAWSVSIHQIDPVSGGLKLVGQQGMPEAIYVKSQNLPPDHPYSRLAQSRDNLISGKLPNLPDSDTPPEYGTSKSPVWFMTAIISIEGKRTGVLSVLRSGATGFRDDEKELLTSISNHLAVAFQNAHLHHNLVQRIEDLEKIKNDLCESEEKMRLTLESLSEAIVVMSLEGRILQANRAAYRMQGYDPSYKFTGKNALRYVAENERRRLLESLKKIRETGVFRKAEYTLVKKDGDTFESECSISLYRNFLGTPNGFVICIRDISARKQTEKRLIENERRYRLITENTSDFIALMTFGGFYAYVSPSYHHLGYEPTELINRSGLDLIHPDDRKYILPLLLKYSQMDGADLARQKKDKASQRLEYRVRDKSGQWHHFDTTGNIIETYDGQGYILLLTSRDVTQRKLAADELKALYAREKETSQALALEISKRADFFRALVHELKTPLTPILVSSETLKDLAPDTTFQNLAGNVYHSAMRLNNRIDELVDISRGEMGLLKLNRDPVDIGMLLKDIVGYVSPQISQNSQYLITDIQKNLPYVNGDEIRIRQIIQNLLDNAMKFTPDNGYIYLEAIADEDNLLVKVRDTGRGIDDFDKERIFQPYNRIESDRQHFSGLGLGLALCKQLVDLHGGKIWIETHKNQGTTFFFTLPVINSAALLPQPNQLPRSAGNPGD